MKKPLSLKGGIHPDENKLSDPEVITPFEISKGCIFRVPFVQHIGKASECVVEKGAEVQVGGLIAKSSGPLSANIHSPVSGIVTEICDIIHPAFGPLNGCVISANGEDDGFKPIGDFDNIIEAIELAGIVGLGGAGFPTHIKLNPTKHIDTLIINASECEPYLSCDHGLMLTKPIEILKAAKLLKSELKAGAAIIAVEENKSDAIKILKRSANDYGIDIVTLEARYPQGGEKQLIKSVLGVAVPTGRLPADVGVIVQNIATVYAVYEAVMLSKPFFERVITVSGDIEKRGNYTARIGFSIGDILAQTGNSGKEFGKIVFGGPMTGSAISSLDTSLMKTTGGVLFFDKARFTEPSPCIRCGRCVDVCVMGLVPKDLESAFLSNNIDKMRAGHIMNCIECGCCSYICPSRRLLAESIKTGKKKSAMGKKG